jgi:hypothetical protein
VKSPSESATDKQNSSTSSLFLEAAHFRKGPSLTLLLVSSFFAAPQTFAALNITFGGTNSNTSIHEGLVSHAEEPESTIFDQGGTPIGHPQGGILGGGVYTELGSADVFNFTTGEEDANNRPSDNNASLDGFLGQTVGHADYVSEGLTSNAANPIYISWSGFTLQRDSTGYVYNTITDVESRRYVNGNISILEELGGAGTDNFVEVAAWTGVVFDTQIDWNDAVGGGAFDPDNIIFASSISAAIPDSKGGTLSTFSLSAQGASDQFPIGVNGSTTEGRYDVYAADANVYTIGAIPEPASLTLLGLGSMGLLLRRRKNA